MLSLTNRFSHSTPLDIPVKLDTTNSPLGLNPNWNQSEVLTQLSSLLHLLQLLILASWELQPPVPLIGFLQAKSPQFKTKLNAVVAGPSPLPDVSHPEELLLDTHLLTTLSNNSLIAPAPSVTMVATVDGWTMPSNTSSKLHSLPLLTIHTLPRMELATLLLQTMELAPFPDIPMSQETTLMLLRTLSSSVQFLLPLKPTKLLSNTIPLVLLPLDAELNSITVSWLSDTELKTEKSSSLSRINGVLLGVTMVTSRSVLDPATFAVSSLTHPSSPSHEHEHDLASYQIMF